MPHEEPGELSTSELIAVVERAGEISRNLDTSDPEQVNLMFGLGAVVMRDASAEIRRLEREIFLLTTEVEVLRDVNDGLEGKVVSLEVALTMAKERRS